MLISYEPLADVLTVTLQTGLTAQTQQQGTVSVALDAAGDPVSVAIPNASTLLWENGGQVSVMLPVSAQVPTVVETTTVVERTLTE